MLIALLEVTGGLVLLFVGGRYLVQGATVIAVLARISTTVVALTVVSMGTSTPELAVSLDAALRGSTDISYGNVIGSNIFNVGAILGVAALLAVIPVRQEALRIEYPIMFVVSLLVVVLAHDGRIDRLDGVTLVILLVTFIGYMVYLSARGVEPSEAASVEREVKRRAHLEQGPATVWGKHVAFVLGGIVALAIGADLAVSGAVTLAERWGIGERVIGLTIIAMGTSLPELATSVMAARQGEQEIALGNVVGSNIFNLLAILGITAVIVPVPVHQRAITLDNWVMLAFSAVMLPMMLRGRRITRSNAILLLTGFAGYMTYVLVAR